MHEAIPKREIARKRLEEFIIPAQVRIVRDEARDRELGESLMQHGQLQPCGCRSDGTLRWGFRRWHAAKLVGLEYLDVIVTDEELTESQIIILQLVENVQRESLKGWEVYESCLKLLNLRSDWRLKDIARQLNRKPSLVTRIMSPSHCIPAVRVALKEGKIGISDCYAISKVPEERQQALLDMKLSGASRDDIERVRRGRKAKWNRSTSRANRISIPMSNGVTVVFSGPNLSTEGLMPVSVEFQKELRKAVDQNLDIKTFQAVMRDRLKGGQ